MARITRAAARREAGFLAPPVNGDAQPLQLSSPPATPPVTQKKAQKTKSVANPSAKTMTNGMKTQDVLPVTPASNKKRKRGTAPKDETMDDEWEELPHNMGRVRKNKGTLKEDDDELTKDSSLPKKKGRASKKVDKIIKTEDVQDIVNKATDIELSPSESPQKKKGRKTKANPYGITPGQTPYPEWPHPTAEECYKVVELLTPLHGEIKAPETIPMPSTTVAGCGEVPSILDALIRTRLSAATTGKNSSAAFKGLVDTFGLLEDGVGKGSVNWDKVRQAKQNEVFEAIKCGGLAGVKSKDIKLILDMVHEENLTRRDELLKEKKGEGAGPKGSENETEGEKAIEVARAEQSVLSLDHLHALSAEEAMQALTKYPGIGVKTASCVILFCMQRPSFAVDTHVFRLCSWLGWVPWDGKKPTRDSTYGHCEVRIPDELKYPLHQYFIKHGKTCPKCKAPGREVVLDKDGEDTGYVCPLDEVIQKRFHVNSASGGVAKKKPGKKSKKSKTKSEEDSEMVLEDGEDESELSELSEMDEN